ncbi:hypothetical protein Acidovoranil_36710 [Acidovorax sp. FG27]
MIAVSKQLVGSGLESVDGLIDPLVSEPGLRRSQARPMKPEPGGKGWHGLEGAGDAGSARKGWQVPTRLGSCWQLSVHAPGLIVHRSNCPYRVAAITWRVPGRRATVRLGRLPYEA